jgi:uncharacterized protein YkwD
MILRYATVIFAAAIAATVVALSVSAIEPKKAEAASVVRTCGGGTIKLKAKEERTFRLHNRARKSRGLRPLCVHPKLTKAARSHSASMIKKDYFGHGSVGRRLKRHGYHWRIYGENIAGGSGSYGLPGNIFRRWMGSSRHRANILDRRFGQVGVGTYKGTYKGTRGYTMYTVDFGTRR